MKRETGRERGVITIAIGAPSFIEMAKWFAMSLRLNAPELPTAILTDSSDPELPELFTHVIPHTPEMGRKMEPKFHLDRLTPFDEALYVDADCLVLNDLTAFFEMFQGQYFAIPGWRYLSPQDSDGAVDVPFVLEHFGIDALAKFNGGCYYLRRGPQLTAFFDTARRLFANAESLRIGDYREGGFSDEPLFAIALALHGLRLTPTGTAGAWTPLDTRGRIELDVAAGRCSFCKQGTMVYPDIVHFPGGYRECYAYHREVWRLKKYFGYATPAFHERARTFIRAMAWAASRQLRDQVRYILRPQENIKMQIGVEAR